MGLGSGMGLKVGHHPEPGWGCQRTPLAELSVTTRCAKKTLFCVSCGKREVEVRQTFPHVPFHIPQYPFPGTLPGSPSLSAV